MKIYHARTTCSRVTLTALEQTGAAYEDQLLDMMAGEHRQPTYLAINPQGKVPALVVDDRTLTENGAILSWLHATFPEAGLLPASKSRWDEARQLSDLFWLASSWHPYVRMNKAPMLFTTGEVGPVRERGHNLFAGVVAQLERRLEQQPWWYGDAWSIVDTYLWWACANAVVGGFSLEGLPRVGEYVRRNEAHPACARALAREQSAFEKLQGASHAV